MEVFWLLLRAMASALVAMASNLRSILVCGSFLEDILHPEKIAL